MHVGIPCVLTSDQGKEFNKRSMRSWWESWKLTTGLQLPIIPRYGIYYVKTECTSRYIIALYIMNLSLG